MTQRAVSATEFVQRWAGRPLNESAAAQSHFNDLCELIGVPKPTDNRVTDSDYGFEARTDISASGVYATRNEEDGSLFYRITTGSGPGFADVWKRNCFAWEYKTANKYRTLDAALAQLRIYAASLGNPPLLIVSDIDRYEIHTNFTNYPATKIVFAITDIAKPSDQWKAQYPQVSPLEVLRKVFEDVDWFKPKKTRQAITREFAEDMGKLAIALRDAGNEPHAVAHLIMQIVFCFFAEDIGLLPRGIFADLIDKCTGRPDEFPAKARTLFKAMELGGHFGAETIEHFNGGLFKDVDQDPKIRIDAPWLGKLLLVAKKEWDAVDPSIFGTLFERSLDPGKRSQIGAHYTSKEDILLIVEPVVMLPLRREWLHVQKDVAEWIEQRQETGKGQALLPKDIERKQRDFNKKIRDRITAFADRVGSVRVLDPACGSGNFLYVTIQQLLDLENDVRAFGARKEVQVTFTPRVQPRQLMGIDINDYACELARVSIWIGYLQWLHANSDTLQRRPILDPLDTIENRDAILMWADERGHPLPVWRSGAKCYGRAYWPTADFIVGNPPFLGSALFRQYGLAEEYVQAMRKHFDLPGGSDLCAFWFEQGRHALLAERVQRVGLLATQGIRGRENRTVLERIKRDGDIFMAWSDRDWVLDGAAVHVSMIGFDRGIEGSRILDGEVVATINIDLTGTLDTTTAKQLEENDGVYVRAPEKGGKFEVDWETAHTMLQALNPNRQSNLDVIRPWVNGETLNSGRLSDWIIDFGELTELEAAKYEKPFEYAARHVRPFRQKNRYESLRDNWWQYRRPGARVREAAGRMPRLLATTMVAKHRIFIWLASGVQPDKTIVVFARSDDYFFGVMQSAIHEIWARKTGTQLREVESGFRYAPTETFESFPLPWAPGNEPVHNLHYRAIAAAAKELNELRQSWLNPPALIKPIEDAVDRFEDFTGDSDEAKPLLRQSAIMARAAEDQRIKALTFTSLYNQRPEWLKIAHRKLDEAMLDAYKTVDPKAPNPWDPTWAQAYEPFGAGEIVIVRKGKKADSPEVIAAKETAIAQRKIIDEKILANLLRLNQERAAAQGAASRGTANEEAVPKKRKTKSKKV